MFSAPANTIGLNTGMNVVHSHDSVVPPYLLATGLSVAAQSYNHTVQWVPLKLCDALCSFIKWWTLALFAQLSDRHDLR